MSDKIDTVIKKVEGGEPPSQMDRIKELEAEIARIRGTSPAAEVKAGGVMTKVKRRFFGHSEDEIDAKIASGEWPEDARDLLDGDELADGYAYRDDGMGYEYKLDIAQACEFERMDAQLATNDEFFAWFDKFVEANQLKGKRRRVRGSGQWSYKPAQSTGYKWQSDWWGGSSYFRSAEETEKLATGLKAANTTVRVVDEGTKRMRVTFAKESEGQGPTSFTSFDESLIVISPGAMLDKSLELGHAIDVTTGYGLHEASHSQETRATMDALKHPTVLRPLAVAGLIHNLFEDVRIERVTSDKFPGFSGYFRTMLSYMWTHVKGHLATKWDGEELGTKLNAIIQAIRWTDEPEREQAEKDAPDLAAEMPWWRDLCEQYATGAIAPRTALEFALNRLKADEQTKKEMEEQGKREQEREAARQNASPFSDLPKSIRDALKDFLEQHGVKLPELCPSPSHSVQKDAPVTGEEKPQAARKLSVEQGKDTDRMVASNLEKEDPNELRIPNKGKNSPTLVIQEPPETDNSRIRYGAPSRGLVQRMRTAFHFRPVAQQFTTRGLKNGMIDEPMLWKAAPSLGAQRDFRVFEQKTIETTPNTQITLLVDISGSMNGHKLGEAMKAAAVMHGVLWDMNGVKLRVRVHTGDTEPYGRKHGYIYKIWEKGQPLTRLGLPYVLPHGNNYDGYAIGWCARELMMEGPIEEQRVVIVLADGLPNGSAGYGGEEAYGHVRETVTWAERNGVDVIQVAVDPYMDVTRQAQMFKHWLPYTEIERLPQQLTSLLMKLFK